MSDTQQKYLEKLENEASVMKEMLKENDIKISDMVAKNDKLEQDLSDLQSKLEKAELDLNKSQSLLADKAKVESDSTDAEARCKELEAEIEILKTKLAKYEELGEAEDVKEAMESAADALDSISVYGCREDVCEKLESYDYQKSKLEKYEQIGRPEEISQVVGEMTRMKFESSANKLAGECGISITAAKSALEKLESYDEAKAFIGSIVSKNKNTDTSVKDKNESEIITGEPVLADKFESEIDIMRKAIKKL